MNYVYSAVEFFKKQKLSIKTQPTITTTQKNPFKNA